MRAALLAARARLRRRLPSTIALALVLAVASGACLASLAGARRTHTAIRRYLDWTHAPSVYVEDAHGHYDELEHLPQVEAAIRVSRTLYFVGRPDGTPDHRTSASLIALLGPSHPETVRLRMLDGRFFHYDDPTEAMVSDITAKHLGVHVGSTIDLASYTPKEGERLFGGGTVKPTGPRAKVHVVGITRYPTDLATGADTPNVIYRGNDTVYITRALFDEHHQTRGMKDADSVADFERALTVRLRNGSSDYDAFLKGAQPIVGRKTFIAEGGDEQVAAAQAQKAARLESLALWIFGAVLAAGILLIGGQALARQVEIEADDTDALRAIGMTRREVATTSMARPAVIVVGAGVAAVGAAILFSRMTPIGIAREAEPDPGIAIDVPILLGGAVVLVLALLARASLTALRLARQQRAPSTAPHVGASLATRLVAGRVPIVPVTGVRFALDPVPGRRRPAAWSAIVGGAIGVLAVTATIVFASSLGAFTGDVRSQGWRWDAAVGNPHGTDLTAIGRKVLGPDRDIASYTAIGEADVRVRDGGDLALLAYRPERGTVPFDIRDGRLPTRRGEVALGGRALRRLHAHVGGTVEVGDGAGHVIPLRVVGEVLVSPLVVNETPELGDGGLVTASSTTLGGNPGAPMAQFLVTFRPGADRAAVLARLRRDFPDAVLTAVKTSDVLNLQRIGALPYILAVMLTIVAIGTIAHALLTSTAGRRREIAALRSLGFVGSQVLQTVWWQAIVIVGLAVAVGVPLGVALGRISWNLLAGELTVDAGPATPFLGLLLLVIGTLVVALAVAALPAVRAASTSPSLALRSE
jgi:hypothetical protein